MFDQRIDSRADVDLLSSSTALKTSRFQRTTCMYNVIGCVNSGVATVSCGVVQKVTMYCCCVFAFVEQPGLFKRGVNHPAFVREIPHFGLFPAFLRKRPAFLALFRSNKTSMKIAIILAVGPYRDILLENVLRKRQYILASPSH